MGEIIMRRLLEHLMVMILVCLVGCSQQSKKQDETRLSYKTTEPTTRSDVDEQGSEKANIQQKENEEFVGNMVVKRDGRWVNIMSDSLLELAKFKCQPEQPRIEGYELLDLLPKTACEGHKYDEGYGSYIRFYHWLWKDGQSLVEFRSPLMGVRAYYNGAHEVNKISGNPIEGSSIPGGRGGFYIVSPTRTYETPEYSNAGDIIKYKTVEVPRCEAFANVDWVALERVMNQQQ